MKRVLKALIRRAASRAPWGMRRALLEGSLDGTRASDMYAGLLLRLGITEIAASGDRGVVSSPAGDRMVIMEYARTGTFAPIETASLTEFFAPAGGTYLDVGANIGLMTIPFARDPRIRCIAFEPEPVNFGFLQRNVGRNAPGSSVELHQLALFHSRSTLSLAIAEGNIGDHRITIGGVPGRPTVEVPAVPLDDYLDRISGPVAAKIDTQGAEPFVIAGGRKMLAKAGLVAIEFCPYLMRELGGDPEIPIALVSDFAAVAVMRGGKADAPVWAGPREAASLLREKLRTATASDEDYVDILARR